MKIENKNAVYISIASVMLMILGVVVTLLLSFHWDFGFQPFEIKSIFTEVGLVSLSIDLEYCIALLMILCLFIGYKLYISGETIPAIQRAFVETENEIKVKYIFAIILGLIGIWITCNEFGRVYLWMYFSPYYVQVSKGSLALRINAVIALLLLVNWFVILGFRRRMRRNKLSESK